MSLQIELHLDRVTLVAGESTGFTVVVRNASTAPLDVPDPERSRDWPKLVVDSAEYSRMTLERLHSHEFEVPLPEETATIPPGGAIDVRGDLLKWIEPLAPGRYRLSARMPGAQSAVALLEVEPLRLLWGDAVGSHSGEELIRYTVLSHQTARGTAILMSLTMFDHEGHPQLGMSTRLMEVDGTARAIPSVSKNGLPYPAHWIAWLDGAALHAMYEKQGVTVLPPAPRAPVTGMTLIGPLLLDLEGNDGSVPGRAEVVMWRPGELAIGVLQPDGSVAKGPTFPLDPGALAFGRAVTLSNDERVVTMAVQRGADVFLEAVRWPRGAPIRVAVLHGEHLASDITLDREDTVWGATITRLLADEPPHAYAMQAWKIAADGQVYVAPPTPIAKGVDFDGAVIGVSTHGALAAALRAVDGRWLACVGSGQLQQIAEGDIVNILWHETGPIAARLVPSRGPSYRRLP
jgi:hypothetical protein